MKLELEQTLELGETQFLKIWCLWDSILDIVVPHVGLDPYGNEIANVALVWPDEICFGFIWSESIFGNLVLWNSMLGALGHRFGSLDASKRSILRVLGSLWAPFLVTFEGPEAPGHAPGGSLCSKGGLDRFWERFWEPNGRPREPKCLPKSI